MINHLSLRLAWHNEGWNGHICNDPKSNVYCVGNHSYPGTRIKEERDLNWESQDDVRGCHCSKLDGIPPCAYSINAFGNAAVKADAAPPDFFRDNTEVKLFNIQPSTACIWPYEEMYNEEVKNPEGKGQTYNYDKRSSKAKEFFKVLTPGKSLIFYYVNKSNPFSEEENPVFVLVGVSVFKRTGDFLYYDNVSQKNKEKYAGGFIWQLPVTSEYPDKGFRIPYQKYLDNPEVLDNIVFIPEYQDNFKYAAKHINDDDALIYIEKLISIAQYLSEIKDDTENWEVRKAWLQSLLTELWANRGAYPGLPSILDYIGEGDLLQYYYEEANKKNSKQCGDKILEFLNDRKKDSIQGCLLPKEQLEASRKKWVIKLGRASELSTKVLSRLQITSHQVANILNADRIKNNIRSTISEILINPYILCEQYVGDDYSDEIGFSKIDHGVLPSPELGLQNLIEKSDWRRLRALMVEQLSFETTHSFVSQDVILSDVNYKMNYYPEWKKETFSEEFIEYDKEEFSKVIEFKELNEKVYCYLKDVYDDEKIISEQIKEMLNRDDHTILKPFKEERWMEELYQEDSPLAKKSKKEYKEAIEGQIEVCKRIFNKPISVLAGSAGTGKTTIIKALIKAIKHSFGKDESFCLLAPTGKAADRIREKAETTADTIHSFLMRNGWLNENFTYKRIGGTENNTYTTIIIDECSMIDISLMAALFRAINWNYLRRIIFVGDPNQLPPIGRGKVFSDIINYIQEIHPDNYGKLLVNIRQMENKAANRGTGIIDLAELYIRDNIRWNQDSDEKIRAEAFLKQIKEGDEDVDKDLKIVVWKTTEDLEAKLKQLITHDLKNENGDIMKCQIISPYKNELFGIENLNTVIQKHLNANVEKYGMFGGIAVEDKIIQNVNRANSTAYWGKDEENGFKSQRVNVYNGELGIVQYCNRRDRKLTAKFERKNKLRIDFYSESSIEENISLAYAISVHKSQGSEFSRIYLVLPKQKQSLLSTELLYTGITRAQHHLTILVEEDYQPLLTMRRPEKSKLSFINSSVFHFKPLSDDLLNISSWYEEGKVNSTLTEFMVRSRAEVIITNMLFSEGFKDFTYEEPLTAPDGTFYLPDFTIRWRGKTYYWEHLGMMNQEKYKKHWKEKEKWYNKHFKGQLLTTLDGPNISNEAIKIIQTLKSGK